MSGSRVLSVNVVHRVRPGHRRDTAIDKRPCVGAVDVTDQGLVGDLQCDQRFHGGVDKAVYAYAEEDATWWSEKLGREVPPGLFGENLTICGLDIGAATIGEVWRIGEVVVEVRSPRTPCTNLSVRLGIPRFHQRFKRAARVGAYLKVLQPGSVEAGLPVAVERPPGHDVTVAGWTKPTPEAARSLLEADLDLADDVRHQAERVLTRTTAR